MAPLAFTHPFRALSLSFKHAPLAVREQLALDEAACQQLLQTLRHKVGLTDVLVLSTCQRTEVYYAAGQDGSAGILHALGQLKNCPIGPEWLAYFEVLDDTAAVRHLFAVALGLEARVLGDWQIIGQVKQAYRWAVQAQAAGPFLHRLLHAVFAAHKRVQQETGFRSGPASASGTAVELVAELTAHLASPRVLVVGGGRIGADVCRHLAGRPAFGRLAICNRTRHKVAALAAECRLELVEFEALPDALLAADVVISAITCPKVFFTAQLVAETMKQDRCKLFVDLSMPRSVAPAVAQVPGVALYDTDAVQSKASAALELRMAALPQVQAIIADCLTELYAWSQARQVSPLIHQLKNHLEHLRQQELRRHGKRLNPTETMLLDATTRSLMQKVLKQQVLHLKRACQHDKAEPLLARLNELFTFENQPFHLI